MEVPKVIDDKYVEEELKKVAQGFISKNINTEFVIDGFCGIDLSNADMSNLSLENFKRLTYDSKTKFSQEQIDKFHPYDIIENGKKFASKENDKLDGKGTTIALIDRFSNVSNKELDGRIVDTYLVSKNGVERVKHDSEDLIYENYNDAEDNGFHGNTVLSLVSGNDCGIAPNSKVVLFNIDGVSYDEAQRLVLEYITKNRNDKSLTIPDIISVSADTNINKSELDNLKDMGCAFINSRICRENFSWGRIEKNNKVTLDRFVEDMLRTPGEEGSKADMLKKMIGNSIPMPVVGRTNSYIDNEGNKVYKYNGSLCGNSFAIPQIAGLYLLAKQINKDISYDDFVNIIKSNKEFNMNRVLKEIEKNNNKEQKNPLYRLVDKIKNIFSKKNFKMLPGSIQKEIMEESKKHNKIITRNGYNLGDVDIEFKTNRVFLLMQCLYRIENIENKINSKNSNLEYLSYDFQEFKNLIENNKQGLSKFNGYKENAENNNMWAEYGEFIKSFAQEDIDNLKEKNPQMAKSIEELMNSKFFLSLEKINNEYSSEIEERFINSTMNYKHEAENIVGKTDTKKIIYMPFTPELFDVEPCCLDDKNGNKEYAVEFTIPTNKEEFEKSFGMEYTEGIESVILFHEKLHADIPPKDESLFKNPMQKELDSHLKHTIIELLANGEMGVDIAKHSTSLSSEFHTGKIYNGNKSLKTSELNEFGIKDNELLHTEAKELNGKKIEKYSKDDMGIIKIRAMMYPYVLMYKNRNNDKQLKAVTDEIRRDSKMIKEIYGEDFLSKIMDIEFLNEIKKNVEPYKEILEFAEGMSKELLGTEQLKDKRKEFFESLKVDNSSNDKEIETDEKKTIDNINEIEYNLDNDL